MFANPVFITPGINKTRKSEAAFVNPHRNHMFTVNEIMQLGKTKLNLH